MICGKWTDKIIIKAINNNLKDPRIKRFIATSRAYKLEVAGAVLSKNPSYFRARERVVSPPGREKTKTTRRPPSRGRACCEMGHILVGTLYIVYNTK